MDVVKVHNCFDEIMARKLLSQPMTPSYWEGEFEYKNIMIVHLTYGGGMGGSHRKIYCDRINNIYDYLSKEQFIELHLINGNTEIVNRNFIVWVDSNYELMTGFLNSKNSNFDIGIHQYNYLVPNGHRVEAFNRI